MTSPAETTFARFASAVEEDEMLARVILTSLGMRVAFLTEGLIARLYASAVHSDDRSQSELRSYVRSFMRWHLCDRDGQRGILGQLKVDGLKTWQVDGPMKPEYAVGLPNGATGFEDISTERVDRFFVEDADGKSCRARRINPTSATLFYLRRGSKKRFHKMLMLFSEWTFIEKLEAGLMSCWTFREWNSEAENIRNLRRSMARECDARSLSGSLAISEIFAVFMTKHQAWLPDPGEKTEECFSHNHDTRERELSGWFEELFFIRTHFVQFSWSRAMYYVDISTVPFYVASWSEFIDLFANDFPSKKWLLESCHTAMALVPQLRVGAE